MSYDNPNWGRKVSPADTYALELIMEVHDYISTCSDPELKRGQEGATMKTANRRVVRQAKIAQIKRRPELESPCRT